VDIFQRYEVKVDGEQLQVTLYLSPFLEEFSEEFWTKSIQKSLDLKESAYHYVKRNIPQVKMATISIVAGGMILSSFPMKSAAHSANFNMSYLFFGNTNNYLSQIDKSKGNLNQVSPSFFDLNTDGTLKVTSQFNSTLVNEIHKRNMKVVPFLSNHWDRELGRTALANREILSNQIAEFIMKNNLDGVNVDIENVTDTDREAYTDLVRLLRQKLPKTKEVSVAVAANPHGWTKGWHGSYDYKKLSQYADYIFIMAYDEHYSGGPAGPVASYGWVEKSIQFALQQGVPKEEIVLGIPFFGRYWHSDGTKPGGFGVSAIQVESLISQYKGSVTYDNNAKSPKATITIKPGDPLPIIHGNTLQPGTYTFWYENANSIKSKVDLVHKYELKGTGSWSLGHENTDIWNNYKQWLTTHVPDSAVPAPLPPPIVKSPTVTSYPLLKLGSKGSSVTKLQNTLKAQKYYIGTVTGKYDTKTKKAVISFQKKYRLKIDGMAGNQVQRKLYSLPKPVSYVTLKHGMKSAKVSDVQRNLKKIGLYNGTVNGTFDTKTKQAVINFQKKYKLRVDGIAGVQTQSKLAQLAR